MLFSKKLLIYLCKIYKRNNIIPHLKKAFISMKKPIPCKMCKIKKIHPKYDICYGCKITYNYCSCGGIKGIKNTKCHKCLKK